MQQKHKKFQQCNEQQQQQEYKTAKKQTQQASERAMKTKNNIPMPLGSIIIQRKSSIVYVQIHKW